MYELGVDVFKSTLSTEDWEPDPEFGGEVHLLRDGGGVEAGIERHTEDVEHTLTLQSIETLLVLEGHATVEIANGPTLQLGPEDFASLPKGARTTWRISAPFRAFWVVNR